jgi:DNA-binding response OmpR family regulator
MSSVPNIRIAMFSSRETRMIKTVVSLTKNAKYLFSFVDSAETDIANMDIAIVSSNDVDARAKFAQALAIKPDIQVLYIGGEATSAEDIEHYVLHKKLVTDLVPHLVHLGDVLMAARLKARATAPSIPPATIAAALANAADQLNKTVPPRTAPTPAAQFVPPAPSPTSAPTHAPTAHAATPIQRVAPVSELQPPVVVRLAVKPQKERLRALVVDDSPTVRAQLVQIIERIGMKCDAAAGGREALNLLAEKSYHIIYVDVVMPDMDGYKLTREIKRNAEYKSTPVIILTSQSSPFDRARGALAGCDTFLTKPVDLKRFYEASAKMLRKSMAVDDLGSWITDPTLPVPTPAPAPAPAMAPPATQQNSQTGNISSMANFRKL